MKKKHTAQLRHRVASTRRISVFGFFNLRVWICLLLVCAANITAYADIITVTNTNDSGPGSLRQALAVANDGDTIDFAVTGPIGLTSGELLVNKVLTISGPGPEALAINGNAKSRVFHVSHPGGNVAVSGLTITNGHATGTFPNDSGGGIYNDHSTLTLSNCAIVANSAAYWGGGIYNDGDGASATLEVNNSSVSGNSGEGAIYNDGAHSGEATVTVSNSSLTNNSGVAIHSSAISMPLFGFAHVIIFNSTISGNASGINNDASSVLGVVNSTISGNLGRGISNAWSCGINNSTVSNNSGGNIYNNHPPAQSTGIDIGSTVLNASPSEPNIINYGTIHSDGYNLSSDNGGGYLNGPGDQVNTDPMLGPLQDNGGPTFTHALLPASPAINASNPNFNPPPFYDQRGPGFDRVKGGRIDVGSFEVQNPLPPPRPAPTPRLRPTPAPRP